jgi:hypothetical protein
MNTIKIRELNDRFRTTLSGGRVMMTSGVDSLPPHAKLAALASIRTFTEFTAGCDPHNEHDFGSIKVDGQHLFWKIDYYTPDLNSGSEDPSDPEKTTRVLTILLASEY